MEWKEDTRWCVPGTGRDGNKKMEREKEKERERPVLRENGCIASRRYATAPQRGREGEREREKEKRSESINGDNRMERAADRETGTYLPTRPGWVQDLGIII